MIESTNQAIKPTNPTRPVDRRELLEVGLILVAVLALDLLLPRMLFGDGLARYFALEQLLRTGTIPESKYSLIMPLFATPLWLLGMWGGGANQADMETQRFNPLLFGIAIIIFYLMLRRRMDGRILRTFLLLLMVASMFPYHLTQFYGEVFTALFVALGTLIATLTAKVPQRIAGWAMVALGVANTPATLAALAVVLGQRIWASRRWRYILVGVGAGALIVTESLIRRGGLFTSGYESDSGGNAAGPLVGGWLPGFNFPFGLGLLSLTLSFGKGLIFYTPGLFLPLRARLQTFGEQGAALWRIYASWLCFAVGLVLIYASWWDWSGDWFWGPRFLLFASIPASFALAFWIQRPSTRLSVNLLTLGALALSLWVGIDGGVFGLADMSGCDYTQQTITAVCQYQPAYSALWRPFVNLFAYGPTARFAQVEGLNQWGALYGVISLAIGAYLALPLITTIARQTRAIWFAQAPAIRARLAEIHF